MQGIESRKLFAQIIFWVPIGIGMSATCHGNSKITSQLMGNFQRLDPDSGVAFLPRFKNFIISRQKRMF